MSRLVTNQQNDCAPNEDSDQPGHPPSLIRVFAVRMKNAWVLTDPLSAQRRLWSAWADAQAYLSLHWTHIHFVGFVMRRLKSQTACSSQQTIHPIVWRHLDLHCLQILSYTEGSGEWFVNSSGFRFADIQSPGLTTKGFKTWAIVINREIALANTPPAKGLRGQKRLFQLQDLLSSSGDRTCPC